MAQNEQHTVEFEDCVQQVMKQGHEKASAIAVCVAAFRRAEKPVHVGEAETQKLHLLSESVRVEGNRVSGVAIHPRRIFHPEEGMTHVYLRKELEKAAPTLVGKPFGIDHRYVLPPPNVVTNAWYDAAQDGVAFEGIVDDNVSKLIRNKAFRGLSIELNWLKPGGRVEFMDGIAPRNFELTSVHFLKSFPPGDKDAFVRLWNGIMEQLVKGPALPLDQRVEAVEKQVQEILSQISVVNGKIDVLTAKERQPNSSGDQVQEAEWTAEYISELPDSAFAAISAGGQRDSGGKASPRALRHLPHHDVEGRLNVVHLRNALARLPQTDLSERELAQAKSHLCAHAKEAGLGSELCGLDNEARQGESNEAVVLRKRIFDLEAKLVESEKLLRALRKRHSDFRGLVESVIPKASVWGSWRPGSRLMVQQLQRVLRESSDYGHESHSWRE